MLNFSIHKFFKDINELKDPVVFIYFSVIFFIVFVFTYIVVGVFYKDFLLTSIIGIIIFYILKNIEENPEANNMF